MATKKMISWQRKQRRVRKKVVGSQVRPRLSVSKSNRYLSVQIIDDSAGQTLASAYTRDPEIAGGKTLESAKKLGLLIAEKAKAKQIEKVVFDRNGYLYHGRVKAIADGAREAGLQF